MFYKLFCFVFLSVCLHCFAVTDDLIFSSITEDKSNVSNTEFEDNLNAHATACECGENSIGCKFMEEKKICDCKEGFVQGRDGICVGACNETQTCQNGGSCLQHLCVCLPGTYGTFCENIYDCLHTDMCKIDENTGCSYDVSRQKAYCRCSTMEYRFDEATKTCRSCLCTPWYAQRLQSFSYCEYQQGQQVCVCTEGYAYNPSSESCDYCNCERNSTWCGFDNGGKKSCGCDQGYFFDGYKCIKCLCGSHGICDPSVFYPSCVCDKGYDVHMGICVECSCGKYGSCLYDEQSRQIGCKCENGYAEKSGICEKCYCGDNINCTFDRDRKVCGCESGYEDVNGFCNDINECQKHNPCKESMICINLPGSYACICRDGYIPVIVETLVKPLEICQDIDECQNSSVCARPHTFCENTIGSFKCICESGFVSRGIPDSTPLCEKSTATSIYACIAIAAFVSLIITGAVAYFVKKTFQRSQPGCGQELK